MGHRLPAAGVPTPMSEHFRFYHVTPPETRCPNESRTRPSDCTLRPKFIARTVFRPAADLCCCPDRENVFVCCSKKKPTVGQDWTDHVRRGAELRCVELLDDNRQDMCRPNLGQGANIAMNTFGDRKRKNFIGKLEDCCPAVVRKPFVLWKREPACRHLGTTYCDAAREKKIQNTECQGPDPMNSCAAICNDCCGEQMNTCLPVNSDFCCCPPKEKITLLCPTVEYVPVVKVDSRPCVPFYGKTNPNYRAPAPICKKAHRPKVCCIRCP